MPRVVELVRSGFPNLSRRTPDEVRALFEYSWTSAPEKPNLGFALWSRDEIVGFLGAVYAHRPLDGRLVMTCNLSTWYVRQEFRGASIKLLSAAMAQKNYSITNFTASPEVRKVMEALRFQTIDHCKWVYLPWHCGREILGCGREVLTNTDEIAAIVQGDERQFLRDHLPYSVKHYLLRNGSDYSYLVLKRRSFPGEVAFGRVPFKKVRLMWYRCMEVLYLGNPNLALQHWRYLVAAIIRRERVLAVVVPERFMGETPPAGARMAHRNYLLAREPLRASIDSLYSEFSVYPF